MAKVKTNTGERRRAKKPATAWTYKTPWGSVEAVPCKALLQDYIRTVEKKEEVPVIVSDFMAYVAKLLLDGKDVRKNLRLQKESCRPRNTERLLAIAKRCLELEAQGGKQLKAIYYDVGKEYRIRFDSVKRIYTKWWFQASLDVPKDKLPASKQKILDGSK